MAASHAGFFLGLVLLSVMGSGPALWLLTPARSPLAALAAAPSLGLCLLGLVATPLVFFGLPVGLWARPLALAAGLAGGLTAAWALWRRGLGPALARQLARERAALLSLAGVFAFLLLPPAFGGPGYVVFRGNQWDAINYAGMAQSVDEVPFRELREGDEQALTNRHSYLALMRRHLVNERQSTSISLAFLARLAGQPVSLFGYHFCLLAFALLFPLLVLLAGLAGLGRGPALLAAGAACLGFWAQLILDSNAYSQLNALPLGALCALAALWASDHKEPSHLKASLALALALSGVAVYYAEYLPYLGLGLALFLAWLGSKEGWKRETGLRALLALGLAVLLLGPELDFYRRFLLRQSRFVADNGSLWWSYFYSWLMERGHPQKFVPGYWGFYLLRSLAEGKPDLIRGPVSAACYFGGWALSALVALNAAKLLGRKAKPALALLACLGLASLLFFAGLGATGRWWTAGKALGFGYAYVVLAAAALALGGGLSKRWAPAAKALGLAWLGLQLAYAPLRVLRAAQGKDYPFPYPSIQDKALKAPSHDFAPLEAALRSQPGAVVAVDIADDWLAEYADLRLSAFRTFRLRSIPDYHTGPGDRWMSSPQAPTHLLLEKRSAAGKAPGALLAQTPELSLYQVSSRELDAAATHGDPLGRGLSLAKLVQPRPELSRLHLVASGEREFTLSWDLAKAPELRSLAVQLGGRQVRREGRGALHGEYRWRPSPGTNVVYFEFEFEGRAPKKAPRFQELILGLGEAR